MSRLADGNASGRIHSETSSNYLCTNDGQLDEQDRGQLAGLVGYSVVPPEQAVEDPPTSTPAAKPRMSAIVLCLLPDQIG